MASHIPLLCLGFPPPRTSLTRESQALARRVEEGSAHHFLDDTLLHGTGDHWEGVELTMDSYTLLTANEVMRPLHDRMPVILPVGEYDDWLDCRGQDAEPLQVILRPSPGDDLIAYPVSMRVNNPMNDSPESIAHLTRPSSHQPPPRNAGRLRYVIPKHHERQCDCPDARVGVRVRWCC